MDSPPLFSRPMGFYRECFYEQECIRIGVLPQVATLLDIQRGNALVLLFEEFREPGSNGLLEIPLDCIQKQYDSANDSGMIDGN